MKKSRNEYADKEDLQRISAWVSKEKKDAFKRLAEAQKKSESAVLGAIVDAVLERNPTPEVANEKELRGDRLSLRFPLQAKKTLGKLARARGLSVSEYSVKVLLSRLKEAPAFTEREMEVLRETNIQLAKIGQNINQIARAINAADGHFKQDAIELLGTFPIEELKKLLIDSRESVMSLAKANISSWSSNDE